MSGRISAGAAAVLCGIALAVTGCSTSPDDAAGAPAGANPPAAGATGATPPASPTLAGSDGAGSARACTVLTAAEVSAALGKQVNDGVKPDGSAGIAGQDMCEWQSSGIAGLILMVDTTMTFEQIKGRFDDSEPVDGVGDEAFYSPSNSVFGLRQGSVLLELTVTGMETGPAKLAFFKDVGAKAAARL